MSDNIFPHDNVRVARYYSAATVGAKNSVRVYRGSPETVCLQIRGDKQFATVNLPFALAKKIARALTEECL